MSDPQQGPVAGLRLVTAHEVCKAVQATLEEHLPPFVLAADLGPQISSWTQIPDVRAVSEASLPSGAISSPGTARTEKVSAGGGVHRWDATWRVGISVFVRGKDYEDTTRRARHWAGLISTVLDQHPRLGWLQADTTWVSEDLAELAEKGNARTLQQALVQVDVDVEDVRPAGSPAQDGSPHQPAPVRFTRTAVDVQSAPVGTPRPHNPFAS